MFNAEVGNVTSQEVTGFSLGTIYYWQVKAGNEAGDRGLLSEASLLMQCHN